MRVAEGTNTVSVSVAQLGTAVKDAHRCPLPAGTGSPARTSLQCSSCAAGDEIETVLCYPPGSPLGASGVTRGAVESLAASQDAGTEAAPRFTSLAAMRAAASAGSRFYYDAGAGLMFVRLRQAAAWPAGGPGFAHGYCPPGGCSWVAVHSAAGGAAPGPADCEARLAAVAGGAPSDATTDPFLSARLPPPAFDLKAACPSLSTFGCDCWGYTGCANRECSAAQRASCDASLDGGSGGTASPPPPAAAASPPPKAAASSPPPALNRWA